MGFMAKNRNKGFSLIEVIIGVAVLTILLTPVVKQLAQTMKTNRLAKEQQYVNECASNLMEETQRLSSTDLAAEASGVKQFSVPTVTDTSADPSDTCQVLIYNRTDNKVYKSSEYSAGGDISIGYTFTVYDMGSEVLGSARNSYTKTVVLDDLSNKISSYVFTLKSPSGTSDKSGLSVVYDVDMSSVEVDSGDLLSGYKQAGDGSIVKYSQTTTGESYISGIVCELKSASAVVSNPNESTLGSMHDLVSTQVALVNGDISKFDEQAKDDINTQLQQYLKEYAPDTYDQWINGQGINTESYINGLSKNIYVTIDQVTTAASPYYEVDVNVSYVGKFVINGVTKTMEELQYTVFSQKFNYDATNVPSPPSVYIIYQPFLVDDLGYSVADYIYIENYVEDAKIYMYKPDTDYIVASGNYYTGSSTTSDKKVYTQTGYSTTPVKIYLNEKVGTNAESVSTTGRRTYLFTNLDLTLSGSNYGQFVTNVNTDSSKYKTFAVNPTSTDGISDSILYLKSVDDDTTASDRLYTATITVAPVSDGVNTITLTGAKGGQ
jgi:prepilin-type N-terminal cleavage/methylation domain-containing protein